MSGHEIPTANAEAMTNPWAMAASRALHPSSRRSTPSGDTSELSPAVSDLVATAADEPVTAHEPVTADEWIWAIASGLAEVTVPWDLRGTPSPSPGERHWELALSTPEYEVWTIYWPPGTGIDLHDHGDSAGAFCVVAGELIETVVSDDGTTGQRTWPRGEGTRFGAGHTHQVVNGGSSTATSVHVYAPPLSAMTYYDGAQEVGRSTLRGPVGTAPGIDGDDR